MLRAAAVVVGLSTAFSLSGCGAIKDAVSDKVDDAVAQATEDAKDAVEDALVTGDANVDLGLDGEASLPDNFPSELPQPDGKLTQTLSDDASWTLAYSIDSIDQAIELIDWYKSADGFTVTQEADGAGVASATFSSDAYSVEIIYSGGDGVPNTLVYGVYKNG